MDHTLTGTRPAFVIVDDPHGFCVPSDGVEIVGRLDHGKDALVINAKIMGMKLNEQALREFTRAPAMGKTLAIDKIVRKRERKLSGIKGLR